MNWHIEKSKSENKNLGEDEPVVVRVTRIFRSILHGVKEEDRHDLCHTAA